MRPLLAPRPRYRWLLLGMGMMGLAPLQTHCSSEPAAGGPSSGGGDGTGGQAGAAAAGHAGGSVPAGDANGGASSSSGGASGNAAAGATGVSGGAGGSDGGSAGAAAGDAGSRAAGDAEVEPNPILDGGSDTAKAVDAGPSASGSCGAGSLLCEGFESFNNGDLPGGIWSKSTTQGAGTLKVDGTPFFSGSRSVHVTGKLTSDKANIAAPLHTTSNTAFVRFMMFTNSYPSSSGVHSRLMRIGTADAANPKPASSFSLASYNGTAIEKVDSIYLRSTATHFNDMELRNRWVCWEFGIDKSGGVGKVEVHIWSDGKELSLSAAGSSTHAGTSTSWDPIPFDLLMFGLDGNQDDAVAADYWIDDLVVATQRVGCPKAP